jgi:hypothetical protein
MSISIPTRARIMSQPEYTIATRVLGNTLPYRFRIIITNGAGLGNRPFTIPISLLSTLGATIAAGFVGAAAGYLTSFINVGYLMNVGSAYPDMSTSNTALLVHETTHVWQGSNSAFSLNYVFNSCLNQCLRGGTAYNYTPGSEWSSYNVEQQASIVEDWFISGEPESGDLWNYVRDYIRQGRMS